MQSVEMESDARSVSGSSLRQVNEPPGESEDAGFMPAGAPAGMAEKPERDILADMQAFQAEIDALRAQQQQQAGRSGG